MALHTFDVSGDLLLLLPAVQEAKGAQEQNATFDTTNTSAKLDTHLLVSSKHMTLASPVFNAMLQNSHFKEGCTLQSTGRVEVPLPEDDPDAFVILMNVIHGRTRQVPRTVSLKLLTSLAIIVDKYQVHEVIETYSDAWIAALPNPYTGPLAENPMSWLAISWVFRKRDEFNTVTRVLILHATEDLVKIYDSISPSLPAPSSVIEAVLIQREKTIHQGLDVVGAHIKAYLGTGTRCERTRASYENDFESKRRGCDAMVLGSLLKSAMMYKLHPVPPSPYGSLTVNGLFNAACQLDIMSSCDLLDRESYGTLSRPTGHGVEQSIQRSINELERGLHGFSIENF